MDVDGLLAALDSGIGAAVAGAQGDRAEAREGAAEAADAEELYALADKMDGAQREATAG